jgi:light-regulated signal transduction histidine kinase (bacteriophytochrome)
VGVCQDVTDRFLAEEQVRLLNVDLERRVLERTCVIENSMRDLEAFNAMVSHDLRAPLAVIQTSCSVIRKSSAEALPPVVQQNLARIERSVGHMTALVNDLLTLAHVGNTALERVEIDASAMCDELLANLRRTNPDREVATRVEPGIRLRGDVGLVRTVLQNIIGNAWKYSSRVPHAIIEVGAFTGSRGPGIFVRDNGAGFDMSDAHRLFLPFERLHKASEFEGTGVGLAAVHRIVERHGGRIWAESTKGAGSTFFVELSAS